MRKYVVIGVVRCSLSSVPTGKTMATSSNAPRENAYARLERDRHLKVKANFIGKFHRTVSRARRLAAPRPTTRNRGMAQRIASARPTVATFVGVSLLKGQQTIEITGTITAVDSKPSLQDFEPQASSAWTLLLFREFIMGICRGFHGDRRWTAAPFWKRPVPLRPFRVASAVRARKLIRQYKT